MKPCRIAGFTLVEVFVVIAIIGVLTISIPPMQQWFKRQGVRHAVNQLQTDLQLARMTAIRQKQTSTVCFNTPGSNQYVLAPGNRRRDLGTYRGNVYFLKNGPDGAKMTGEVNFDRRGMSTSVVPADIFLSNAEGSETYRVRILLPGGISVYRWNGDRWH